jgi:ribose transport system substrate-binding protein
MRRKALVAAALVGVAAALASTAAVTNSNNAFAARKAAYKITLIQGIAGDAFYGSMACGAKSAAKALNVDLTVTGGQQWSPTVQTPLVNSVVARRPDAILIAPNDPKAMMAPLKQAADAGIKIVLVDTSLADTSLAVSEVTSSNKAAGAAALNTLAKLIGKKGSVFVLSTIPGVSTTDDRAAGFRQAIKSYPKIKDLGIQYDTADTADKAAAITAAQLARHKDLAGVFALNTFTAQGAAQALKEAGKLGKVKLVGFDANPSGVEALKAGTAQAQVVLKPLDIGYQGVVQAVAALSGKPVTKKMLTGAIIATTANLNSAPVQKYLYRNSCS